MEEDKHTRPAVPVTEHPLPFPCSYWVSHPHLLAGCYPGDKGLKEARAKISGLLVAGVGLIVNLMEQVEIGHDGSALDPYEMLLAEVAADMGVTVRMDRFSIPDINVPTPAHMTSILNAIDQAIAAGTIVYLHCWGGRGRTGTVVGCWLARHGIATGEAALERIAELRAGVPKAQFPSPETEAQCAMVRGWEESHE